MRPRNIKLFNRCQWPRSWQVMKLFNAVNIETVPDVFYTLWKTTTTVMLLTIFVVLPIMSTCEFIDLGSCAKTQRYKYFYSIQTQGIKIQRYKKSWIMLENTKKILQIQTVEQWHRKKWNVLTLIMNNSKGGFGL